MFSPAGRCWWAFPQTGLHDHSRNGNDCNKAKHRDHFGAETQHGKIMSKWSETIGNAMLVTKTNDGIARKD